MSVSTASGNVKITKSSNTKKVTKVAVRKSNSKFTPDF